MGGENFMATKAMTEKMSVSEYAEDLKASFAQCGLMVDDMVEHESDDGKIDTTEVLEMFFKHGAAFLAIWGHRIPWLNWIFRK